jgi:hypothetical protein
MCRVRVSVSESTYGEKERVRRVLQLATTWWEEKEESPCTCVAAFMARLAMRQREEQGEGGKELAIAMKARIQYIQRCCPNWPRLSGLPVLEESTARAPAGRSAWTTDTQLVCSSIGRNCVHSHVKLQYFLADYFWFCSLQCEVVVGRKNVRWKLFRVYSLC